MTYWKSEPQRETGTSRWATGTMNGGTRARDGETSDWPLVPDFMSPVNGTKGPGLSEHGRLAGVARVPFIHPVCGAAFGDSPGARTRNLRIKSPLLYH